MTVFANVWNIRSAMKSFINVNTIYWYKLFTITIINNTFSISISHLKFVWTKQMNYADVNDTGWISVYEIGQWVTTSAIFLWHVVQYWLCNMLMLVWCFCGVLTWRKTHTLADRFSGWYLGSQTRQSYPKIGKYKGRIHHSFFYHGNIQYSYCFQRNSQSAPILSVPSPCGCI